MPAFLPLDVLNPDSYKSYAYQFSSTQVVIFNYLFSENKTRLSDAQGSVAQLYSMAASGCVFVVIDRLENNPAFKDDVIRIFKDVFNKDVALHTFAGTLDGDEQTRDLGDMLSNALGNPRVKFFTEGYRSATVFWFTLVKE